MTKHSDPAFAAGVFRGPERDLGGRATASDLARLHRLPLSEGRHGSSAQVIPRVEPVETEADRMDALRDRGFSELDVCKLSKTPGALAIVLNYARGCDQDGKLSMKVSDGRTATFMMGTKTTTIKPSGEAHIVAIDREPDECASAATSRNPTRASFYQELTRKLPTPEWLSANRIDAGAYKGTLVRVAQHFGFATCTTGVLSYRELFTDLCYARVLKSDGTIILPLEAPKSQTVRQNAECKGMTVHDDGLGRSKKSKEPRLLGGLTAPMLHKLVVGGLSVSESCGIPRDIQYRVHVLAAVVEAVYGYENVLLEKDWAAKTRWVLSSRAVSTAARELLPKFDALLAAPKDEDRATLKMLMIQHHLKLKQRPANPAVPAFEHSAMARDNAFAYRENAKRVCAEITAYVADESTE